MIWGITALLISIHYTISIERVKRNPELFRSHFMVAYTRSPVLAWYFRGRRKDAANALADDPVLRRKYIIECYLWNLLLVVSSVGLIINSIDGS